MLGECIHRNRIDIFALDECQRMGQLILRAGHLLQQPTQAVGTAVAPQVVAEEEAADDACGQQQRIENRAERVASHYLFLKV